MSDLLQIKRLLRRPQFLAAAKGVSEARGGVVIQRLERGDGSPHVGMGFTATRKIGGAVQRNRAKRRLREVAQLVLPGLARPGWDYVLVGKPGATIARDFATLLDDLRAALDQVHRDRPPKAPK